MKKVAVFEREPNKLCKENETIGVFFADNLSWNHHIKHVQTKLNKVDGLINRQPHENGC